MQVRCFSWARMAVGDSQTPRSHYKDTVIAPDYS